MFAYLDPGAGSLLIQVVIAVLASTSFLLRHYIGGACRWVYRKVAGPPTPAVQPVPAAEPQAADSPAQVAGN
jgi:hypothetical protein